MATNSNSLQDFFAVYGFDLDGLGKIEYMEEKKNIKKRVGMLLN